MGPKMTPGWGLDMGQICWNGAEIDGKMSLSRGPSWAALGRGDAIGTPHRHHLRPADAPNAATMSSRVKSSLPTTPRTAALLISISGPFANATGPVHGSSGAVPPPAHGWAHLPVRRGRRGPSPSLVGHIYFGCGAKLTLPFLF